MSKRKGTHAHRSTHAAPLANAGASGADLMTQSGGGAVAAFSFGDPEPVSRIQLLDYVESMFNGRWYEPPLPWEGLASALHASPHHGSAIRLKRNLRKSMFIPHPRLSTATFGAMALDFLALWSPRAGIGRVQYFERQAGEAAAVRFAFRSSPGSAELTSRHVVAQPLFLPIFPG